VGGAAPCSNRGVRPTLGPALAGLVLTLGACGGPALQTVRLVNRTSRPIDQIYLYPPGATAHGTSRGSLAPNASTQLRIKPGGVEVMGVSAKLKVDEKTRDQPSASLAVEVRGPTEVIFYDEGARPPGLDRPGVFGIGFVIPKGRAAPDEAEDPAGAPTEDPAPDPDAPPPAE